MTELVDVRGTRVATFRAPRASAPRILLLAPWPQTHRSFEGIAPILARSLDVTAIDLPGFGHSEAPREALAPSSLARFLRHAFDHFGIERAHLVGTDVGVPVALSFASHHADRLHSLVLSDGPGTASPTLNKNLRRMVGSRFFRWLFTRDPAGFVRIAMRDGYVRTTPDAEKIEDFISAYRDRAKLRATLDFLATYPRELAKIDATLYRIVTPTLLLWGARDVFVPPENARALQARLRNAVTRILDTAGHFSHDDDPEGYASALVEWCHRDPRPSSVSSRLPAGAVR